MSQMRIQIEAHGDCDHAVRLTVLTFDSVINPCVEVEPCLKCNRVLKVGAEFVQPMRVTQRERSHT